jgi:hypothetical protein
MTASLTPSAPARSGPSPVVALVIGAVTTVSVFTLIIAGITFVGLAIAFPIAVPVAQAYHVPIAAADAALAERFAGLWWAFAALAVVAFSAAALVTVKVADILAPRPRD